MADKARALPRFQTMRSPVMYRVARILALISLAVFSCKKKPPTASGLRGELTGEFGVMKAIHNPVIRVCLIPYSDDLVPADPKPTATPAMNLASKVVTDPKVSAEELRTFGQNLKFAYAAWIAPLKEFDSEKQWAADVKILSLADGCKYDAGRWKDSGTIDPIASYNSSDSGRAINKDISDVTVVIYPKATGRANVTLSHEPGLVWMKLSSENDYRIILHEVGHTFGLDDTYEAAAKVKPGQPFSVMNFGSHVGNAQLYPDDIEYIKLAYCSVYFTEPKCLALPDRKGELPSRDIKGQLVFSNGVTLEQREYTYTEKVYSEKTEKFEPTQRKRTCGLIVAMTTFNAEGSGLQQGDCIVGLYGARREYSYVVDQLNESLEHAKESSEMAVLVVTPPDFDKMRTVNLPIVKVSDSVVRPEMPDNGSDKTIKIGSVVVLTRDAPLMDGAASLGIVPKLTHVTVLAVNGAWISVKYYNRDGWIQQSGVKLFDSTQPVQFPE